MELVTRIQRGAAPPERCPAARWPRTGTGRRAVAACVPHVAEPARSSRPSSARRERTPRSCAGCIRTRATITARNVSALSPANPAAGPASATTAPPSAETEQERAEVGRARLRERRRSAGVLSEPRSLAVSACHKRLIDSRSRSHIANASPTSSGGVSTPSAARPRHRAGAGAEPELGANRETPAIDDVGQGTRGQRQEKSAAPSTACSEATIRGDGGERRHQPPLSHAVHPGADVRHQPGDP